MNNCSPLAGWVLLARGARNMWDKLSITSGLLSIITKPYINFLTSVAYDPHSKMEVIVLVPGGVARA